MPRSSTGTPGQLIIQAERDRLRDRWGRPEFAAARDALQQRADIAVADNLRPVGEAGGWGHAFHCPDHVVPLDFEQEMPSAHRCPVDGKEWSGPDFDGGWRCALNGKIQSGIQACSAVWLATGEQRYLTYAVEVLLDYADRYPGLPESGRWVGKGKVTGQSLEEAVWSISICKTFDAISDTLSDADRDTIKIKLLRGLADHVTGQLMGKIHNIECWHLAALINLGVVLGEDDLVTAAVDGEFGLTAQLGEGILDDGWWAEGSPHYHYYMLSAALAAASALRTQLPAFLETPGLREMVTTPLSMMRSDYSLPALNDGWNTMTLPLGVAEHAAHYEQAYGLWGDERFADFLADVYGKGVPRTGEAALSQGPDLTTPRSPRDWPLRVVHPASGYAVLADGRTASAENIDGQTDERYLLLKFGPHGGGHGHPDKLQLDLHAFGVRLAPDAGSPAYTSPLQGPWVRQTLSHNTVLLDHTSQPEAEGRLLAFQDATTEPVGLIDAEVSWPSDPNASNGRQGSWLKEPRLVYVPAYAGARLRRTVLWKSGADGYFIDLVQVQAPEEVPIDLVWHHRGQMITPGVADLRSTHWDPPNETYAFLRDVHSLPELVEGPTRPEPVEGHDWQATWEVEGAGTKIWAHDPDGAETLFAKSPSNPPAEEQTTTLRRVHGRHAVFASVIEPVRGHPSSAGTISDVHWSGSLDDDGLTVTVQHRGGSDVWEIRVGAENGTMINRQGDHYACSLARSH